MHLIELIDKNIPGPDWLLYLGDFGLIFAGLGLFCEGLIIMIMFCRFRE